MGINIRKVITQQITDLRGRVVTINGYDPHRTPTQKASQIWCARQLASTTIDFVDAAKLDGIISAKEQIMYVKKIQSMIRLLYNSKSEVA